MNLSNKIERNLRLTGKEFRAKKKLKSKQAHGEIVSLIATLGYGKFGTICSKKVNKKAVVRHQLKRWLRADWAQFLKGKYKGYDIVIRINKDVDDHKTLTNDLLLAFDKLSHKLS